MEGSLNEIFQLIQSEISLFLGGMLQKWRLYQVGIIIGLWIAAFGFGHLSATRLRTWMRTLTGWPKWRLRALLVLEKRLTLIWFVILAWSLYLIMQEVTWPSRSYLIRLAVLMASAWLFVSLITKLVRNPFLQRVVSWGLWIYVTLYYLGMVELATTALDGLAVEFGDFRLSALSIVKALIVTGLLFTLARTTSHTATRKIRGSDDISPSMKELAVKFLQVSLYGSAFFIGLKAVGFDLTGLAVLSGAIGVGLGFGLQKVVSNLVSGIIILLDKSVKPGDVISLGETFGWINALGARYVSVVTRDGKEYLIPNEDLITGQVVNWSHSNEFVRLDLFFGTSYGDNPHLVRKVAIQAALDTKRVLKDRAPVCHIVGYGDSSVDYILRFWITDPTGGLTNVKGDVYLALWDAFQENGISIPFPQREVRILGEQVVGMSDAQRAKVSEMQSPTPAAGD